MEEVVQRFLRYVQFNTTADEKCDACPSCPTQLVFAQELAKELRELGLEDVEVDEKGYVLATLPGNTTDPAPVIGFIAHMDTSPDCSAEKVKPNIIRNYPGGDILLNKERNIVLKAKDFPELEKYRGQDLITTDGTTLLGADDKAGIAEIITAVSYLLKHPEIKHGPIRIGFTPDEEIGRGADHFNVVKFGAHFAYTIDGGELGELEAENFNAASATFTVHGKSVHPGAAKNKMVNSLLIAREIIAYFPENETPATTEGYQGFYHLHQMNGSVEKTVLKYLIRDHDRKKFALRKEFALSCQEFINRKYGQSLVELEIKDSYYNMKEVLDKHPHVIELAVRAMRELNIQPVLKATRGGTDGARLSFMGLPTPNIFTGGHNFHGPFEFVVIQSMEKAVQTIVKICELGRSISM